MLSFRQMHDQIAQGTLRPSAALDVCREHIDRRERTVAAWCYRPIERAIAQAKTLDEEQIAGKLRGPLHGIPLGIKDIFDVAEMPTSAGAQRWRNAVAREDCTVVKRLRQAGAILIGKTVTTAYASFDPPITRNPYHRDHTPGGSSSGSAAAVGASMCPGAIGSQTGGSTTRPGSYCGVPSLKPTIGQIPLDGVVPLAPTLDHVGIYASDVFGLEAIYGVLNPIAKKTDSSQPVHRLRLLDTMYADHLEKPMADALGKTISQLSNAAWEISPFRPTFDFERIAQEHRQIMGYEAYLYHRDRRAFEPNDYPEKFSGLMDEAAAKGESAYITALHYRRETMHRFWQLFLENDSLMLCPAATGPAPKIDSTGNPIFNSIWSFLGLPTLSLPMPVAPGELPLSLQLIAPGHAEGRLFAAGKAIEEVLLQKIGKL